jgi:hypothetical protein
MSILRSAFINEGQIGRLVRRGQFSAEGICENVTRRAGNLHISLAAPTTLLSDLIRIIARFCDLDHGRFFRANRLLQAGNTGCGKRANRKHQHTQRQDDLIHFFTFFGNTLPQIIHHPCGGCSAKCPIHIANRCSRTASCNQTQRKATPLSSCKSRRCEPGGRRMRTLARRPPAPRAGLRGGPRPLAAGDSPSCASTHRSAPPCHVP